MPETAHLLNLHHKLFCNDEFSLASGKAESHRHPRGWPPAELTHTDAAQKKTLSTDFPHVTVLCLQEDCRILEF